MSKLFVQKYVSSLPEILEGNTMYLVRVGAGVDIYITNESGTVVAFPINANTLNQYNPTAVEEFAVTDGAAVSETFTIAATTYGVAQVFINGQLITTSEHSLSGQDVTITPEFGWNTGDVVSIVHFTATVFEGSYSGDITILGNGNGLHFYSPNGTEYKLTVNDAGNLVTTAV